MRHFTQTACFDWSGQNVARPKGIALATMRADAHPQLIRSGTGWSRDDALGWLLAHADAETDILIGIDLSAGLPFTDYGAYFPGWDQSPPDAKSLWALTDRICADDDYLSANSFVAHSDLREYFRHTGYLGTAYGDAKSGRLRVTEQQSRMQGVANPYSSLNLVGAAQVGKSSLTGMRVLHRLNGRIPVWPFDAVPMSGPLIVEIYTSIAAVAAGLPRGRTKIRDHDSLATALGNLGAMPPPPEELLDDHSADALMTAAWLQNAAQNPAFWHPEGMTKHIAKTEGWTFGVF